MSKVLDYMEKHTDKNGEIFYRYRPLLQAFRVYSPEYLIKDDS